MRKNTRQDRGPIVLIKDIRRNPFSYILLFPAFLYIAVFSYMAYPYLIAAFQKFNFRTDIFNSQFIGLKNLEFFFRSPRAGMVTFNTIYLNLLGIGFGTFFSVLFAILFNELKSIRFAKVTQASFLFPSFVSWVIVNYMVYALISPSSGLVNVLMKSMGMAKINWYSNASYWPAILTILNVWKTMGMNMVIYLAAITGFDPELNEAAFIDGAGRFKQVFYITLPQLMPLVCLMLLMAAGKVFYGNFNMLYAVIGDNGVLYSTTDVIDTYVFRALRKSADMSQALAAGLYQSVMGFVLVFMTNFIARKFYPEGALF